MMKTEKAGVSEAGNDRRPVLVFDVNETLLDIDALELSFSACSVARTGCASGSHSSFFIPRPCR